MARRGERSEYATQRRSLSHIVQEHAHVDLFNGDQVNTLNRAELYNKLYEKHGAVDIRVIREYEQGEILSDPRGTGSHQKEEKADARKRIRKR